MSREFAALLAFMFAFVIGGVMFDGLDSTRGIIVTIIASIVVAGIAYAITPRSQKKAEEVSDEKQGHPSFGA